MQKVITTSPCECFPILVAEVAMQVLRIGIAIVVIAAFFVGTGTAFSQESSDTQITVASILAKADCPLTKEQQKQLDDMDMEGGWEVFRTLNGMFDDTQTEALKKVLGTRPGRNDRPDRPRYLMQVVIFEKAGCPLTAGQLEKLLKLPNERGSSEAAREIYTEKQSEEMGKIFRNRQR